MKAEVVNKLTSYGIGIVGIAVVVMLGINAYEMFSLKKQATEIAQKQQKEAQENANTAVVEKDLIFRLPDGTLVKVQNVSPLVITGLKTGIVLEKNGQYYYYTKGNKLYILSAKEYMKLVKEQGQ